MLEDLPWCIDLIITEFPMSINNTSNGQDVSSANLTARAPVSGPNRSPRHVQWASKPQVEHVEWVSHSDSEEEDHGDLARTLDEHGSDPAALASLHRALESYLNSHSWSSTSKFSPRAKHTRLTTQNEDDLGSAADHQPHAESSRQGAQRTEEEFDERVFVDTIETAGLPASLSTRIHEGLQNGGDEEMEVEEHGREEEKRWARRARSLVKEHTSSVRRNSVILRTKTSKQCASLQQRRDPSDAQRDEKVPSKYSHDPEANAGGGATNHISPLPRGQGVLSTLFALYNAEGGDSGSSSAVTSCATTTPDDSDKECEVLPYRMENQRQRSPPTSYFNPHAPTASAISALPNTSASAPSSASLPPEQMNQFHTVLPTASSTMSSLHLPTLSTFGTRGGRPKAAQNAGGVIGSLIATSGNLTGPAAPVPSTIGPNIKRKGFGLSRYEIEPDTSQWNPQNIDPRRIRSAPATPQPYSGADYTEDSAPASDIAGTATPESTSDSLTSQRNGRLNKKHKRHSLATLTEWMPPSLHSRLGSRAPSPIEKIVTGDIEADREHGTTYRRGKKERRRKAEIFITKHIAELMQRQEFLLKLARALMMFAAPTHRLQAQLQATARVLDLEVSTLYLPNVMLISFGDAGTSTSNLKFIQQGSSLDLGKLYDAHKLYWKVIHDKISVSSASASLDFLMHKPPLYHGWQEILLGGLCSSSICSLAFSGSFVDSLAALPLGSLLVIVQIFSARNELYSNVFEITIATLLSFISAALASTSRFCYAAVASSSVVLILPGFIVLSGSLELASRQIVSGAVRICFAVIYSLFLGFGIAMGAEFYSRMTGLTVVGPDDYLCGSSHKSDGPWWQRTASIWWAMLCVPMYSLFLSLRNQAPLWRKEMAVTILISCGGWAANHFSGLAFVGRPDIQSAIGAFAVGIVANTYAKFFSGNAYVVMITGILFQLPSGLANGGLLTFAANDNKGQQFESYQAGFQVTLQLVAVGIGLTVGLFTSVVIVHPLGGSRRRSAGLFSL